jgi:glycogen synthase
MRSIITQSTGDYFPNDIILRVSLFPTVEYPRRSNGFVSYESPFAPGGGIAAVMKHLPAHLSQASKSEVIVITPFHRKIQKTVSLEKKMSVVAILQVKFEDRLQDVQLLRLDQDGIWYFLKPADPRLFIGARHPYDVDSADVLTRDALFFGIAAAAAVVTIDKMSNWTLLLQDWEAAPTALAVADVDSSTAIRTFLTLHNGARQSCSRYRTSGCRCRSAAWHQVIPSLSVLSSWLKRLFYSLRPIRKRPD